MLTLCICIAGLILFTIIWAVGVSNAINRIQLKIKEAQSGIEIQLRKRNDTLTESMNIAKGYAKHEKELFTGLRSVNSGMGVREMNDCISSQSQCMRNLVALGESYPELKSAEIFMNLQRQLAEENAQFAAAKRAFNSNTTAHNNIVVTFPKSVICSMRGVGQLDYIKEDNIQELKNVSMEW
ncbi:MAG: LemA family protein [Roseburia sp.]|nr:LemA family protein [Roseburia sp.]